MRVQPRFIREITVQEAGSDTEAGQEAKDAKSVRQPGLKTCLDLLPRVGGKLEAQKSFLSLAKISAQVCAAQEDRVAPVLAVVALAIKVTVEQ